jgi:histone deacetylase complex regulatory component SIN3
MKTTNNKTTNGMSKATLKAVETINTIKAQETKSAFDLQKLANAIYKVEAKSISHVYKQVCSLYEDHTELGEVVRELAGTKLPTFKAFATAYKGSPCLWFGFATLRKLNPKFKLAEKVKRQNKATAKK